MRYRPSERADLEAHAAKMALLASDLADIPEKQLRIAIERWIANSPFLPKAADLIKIAQNAISSGPNRRPPSEKLEALRRGIAGWNARLFHERPELAGQSEWRVDDDGNAYIYDLSEAEKQNRRFRA